MSQAKSTQYKFGVTTFLAFNFFLLLLRCITSPHKINVLLSMVYTSLWQSWSAEQVALITNIGHGGKVWDANKQMEMAKRKKSKAMGLLTWGSLLNVRYARYSIPANHLLPVSRTENVRCFSALFID